MCSYKVKGDSQEVVLQSPLSYMQYALLTRRAGSQIIEIKLACTDIVQQGYFTPEGSYKGALSSLKNCSTLYVYPQYLHVTSTKDFPRHEGFKKEEASWCST